MVAISKGSSPTKAGETTTATTAKVSFEEARNVAATKLEALLRGGVECITYIASALLCGYLAKDGAKIKLSVMRDEFGLALKKKGLGSTQTNKYLDYGQKIAAQMFKETSYGMEMAALIAADNPNKAHAAVVAWLQRHTKGKKTEHGTKLDDAAVKLSMLEVFLKVVDDPGKPEALEQTDAEKAAKVETAQKSIADKITKTPELLAKADAGKVLAGLTKVITFDVLVGKHVDTMTDAKALMAELKAIEKSYKDRIRALSKNMGKKVDPENVFTPRVAVSA